MTACSYCGEHLGSAPYCCAGSCGTFSETRRRGRAWPDAVIGLLAASSPPILSGLCRASIGAADDPSAGSGLRLQQIFEQRQRHGLAQLAQPRWF